MKWIWTLIFCSVFTLKALASSTLLPKKATLISDSGEEVSLYFSSFEMSQVAICPGSFDFIYGNQHQYRSLFQLIFNGEVYHLYNHPCSQGCVNSFYLIDQSAPVELTNISGGTFSFVKAQGREEISITSTYIQDGLVSRIEKLNLYHQGISYKFELNRTGTLSE